VFPLIDRKFLQTNKISGLMLLKTVSGLASGWWIEVTSLVTCRVHLSCLYLFMQSMYYPTVGTAEHVCHHIFVKHRRICEMPETTFPGGGTISCRTFECIFTLNGVEFLW